MSFVAIAADSPWKFYDKLPGNGRGAEKHYECMTVDDLCDFAVPPTEPNAWLFFWRVSSMVEEAYRVVRAWGFVPKSEIVWEKLTVNGKPHFGMGRYVRASHETCIVAVKGRPRPVNKGVRSRFSAPVGLHSEKPAIFFDIVDQLVGPGPKAEMFARKERPVLPGHNWGSLAPHDYPWVNAEWQRKARGGWTAFGNEVS